MSFFQNVFDFEFRPSVLGADRQYQIGFKLPANTNRSDYMLSGNAEPFDFSSSDVLTINYAIDINFVNYASINVNVAGTNPDATSATQVANALNSNPAFSELFTATVYSSSNNAVLPKKVLIKGKNNKSIFRAYISNTGAERYLQFNKNAPVRELPSLFSKYSIANRFANPTVGVDRIIELNTCDPYDASLVRAAGFDPTAPKPDWELMQGVNNAFWFYNRTYLDSKIATEIKYQAGAKVGDLAMKTFYSYSGSDLIGVMETPYVLQAGDLVAPPQDPSYLWGWGRNNNGQLGTDDTNDRSSPVQTITFGSDWKLVRSNGTTTAAVKQDSSLWVYGYNGDGQLGTNDTTDYSSPVQTVCGGNNWEQVSVGEAHMAAIKIDGSLWLWGNNYNGQLGNNDTSYLSSPVQTVCGGNNWASVSCGYACTAAIKDDGSLWMWGNNYFGQLGDGNSGPGSRVSSPVQTIANGKTWNMVDCGYAHTAAIKNDGSLWVWGGNFSGQLGTDDSNWISSPAQTVCAGSNWMKVNCGGAHTIAVKSDNTLWAWGNNYSGQVGDDSTYDKSSPVQIGTDANWSCMISAGVSNSAAIKSDGTLWGWGEGSNGQNGDNTTNWYSSPVQTITNGTTWTYVDCGYFTTTALKK